MGAPRARRAGRGGGAVRDHYYIYALDREAVAVWSVGCGFLGVRECVVLISYLKSAKIRSEFLNATVS